MLLLLDSLQHAAVYSCYCVHTAATSLYTAAYIPTARRLLPRESLHLFHMPWHEARLTLETAYAASNASNAAAYAAYVACAGWQLRTLAT